jgi:geranylgeranyl reductase family protein
MEECDVLIVGGGPAGSSCAWKLAGAGLRVLVLDRKTFPRDKPCAGWITPAVVEELKLDLDDYRRGRVLEPITGFCVSLMGGPEVEAGYGRPISYGIRRCEFDEYLLRRSGAGLRLGQPLQSLDRADGRWLVNGRIQARMLVGAGGHFCPVARSLAGGPGEGAVVAQEIEFEMHPGQLRICPVKPGVPYLYFCTDLKGYGWYYRKGDYLNVGLGREDGRQLAEHVAAFCDFLKQRGKIPADAPARAVGHAYLLYEHSRRPLVEEGALLVGDAAGMAYAPSGEGIRPAVETGLLAAEVIAAAAGDYRRENLEPYRALLTARFGKRRGRSASDLLPLGLRRFAAGLLIRWPWFTRHVIVDRWFLRSNEPALNGISDGGRRKAV